MSTHNHEALTADTQRAITEYEEDIERAIQTRDEKFRQIMDKHQCKQADLIRAAGLSRETIRQALNPEIREAIKARRAAKKKEA